VWFYNTIVSFENKETEKIWRGERVKKLPFEIQQKGKRQKKRHCKVFSVCKTKGSKLF